jgi:hypothetical protein
VVSKETVAGEGGAGNKASKDTCVVARAVRTLPGSVGSVPIYAVASGDARYVITALASVLPLLLAKFGSDEVRPFLWIDGEEVSGWLCWGGGHGDCPSRTQFPPQRVQSLHGQG